MEYAVAAVAAICLGVLAGFASAQARPPVAVWVATAGLTAISALVIATRAEDPRATGIVFAVLVLGIAIPWRLRQSAADRDRRALDAVEQRPDEAPTR